MRGWRAESSEGHPETAAEWAVRMRSGTLTQRERSGLRDWMDESPDNVRELLRIEATWRLSGALGNHPDVLRELENFGSDGLTKGHRTLGFTRGLRYPAVIFALTVLVAAILWLTSLPSRYETARGEQRVLTLADGSVVALNTDTLLSVRLTDRERTVWLQRGEALFQVKQDSARPFIVRANNGYARAIGTRFDVLAQSGTVMVSVLEGRVQVSGQDAPTPAANASAMVLQAGQATAYESSGKVLSPEPMQASTERITAWREGKLRFDSWPLQRAIFEYNRYAKKPIRLTDNLGNVRISGVFRIGDSDGFVGALAELVNGKVVDDGDTLLLMPGGIAHSHN